MPCLCTPCSQNPCLGQFVTSWTKLVGISYWGILNPRRRCIGWHERTYVSPKRRGSIGLRLARHVNDSFMMKVAWELCMKPSHMWVRVVRAKYAYGEDHWCWIMCSSINVSLRNYVHVLRELHVSRKYVPR